MEEIFNFNLTFRKKIKTYRITDKWPEGPIYSGTKKVKIKVTGPQ